MLTKKRSHRFVARWSGARAVGPLAIACLVALASPATDAFAAQLPVPLRAADSFAVLAGQTVTNAGFSTINGDLGVSPGTALTGFPPGTVNGTIHAGDPAAAAAQADLTTAYNDAAGRTPPIALPADAGGMTLAPGVHKSGAALGLTGTVTLDGQGDPNAVFVFQVGSALTTAVGSQVDLVNGAQPCNVFWQIGSSATLGTSSVFAGNILALSSISMNDGVTLNGRALARNGSVSLIRDTITAPHCATSPTPTPTSTPKPSPTPKPVPTPSASPAPTVGRPPVTFSRPRCTRQRCPSQANELTKTLYAKKRKAGRRCPIFVYTNVAPRRVTAAPVRFVATNLRPQFKYKLGYSNVPKGSKASVGQSCGRPTPAGPPDLIVKAAVRMELRVNSDRGAILNRKVDLNYKSASAARPLRQADFRCRPATDGNTDVNRDGNGIRRVTLKLISLRGTTFLTDPRIPRAERLVPIIPGEQKLSFTVRCPSTEKRRDYEEAAWRELWGYNPRTGTTTSSPDTKKAGRRILRARLLKEGELPKSGGKSAWEAHHIVPIAEKPRDRRGYEAFRLVVPGAFRCHLYPNELADGVFLRQRRWQRETDRWKKLSSRDQRRQWHPLTLQRFSGQYFRRLQNSFRRSGALKANGACASRVKFKTTLKAIKGSLASNRYVPASQEPRGD